jgi:hypothetical protein
MNKHQLFLMKVAGLLAGACVLSTVSVAGSRGEHRGPPAEAIAACASLSEGSSCQFVSRRGDQITGSCRTHENTHPLACHPAHIPRHRRAQQEDGSTPQE